LSHQRLEEDESASVSLTSHPPSSPAPPASPLTSTDAPPLPSSRKLNLQIKTLTGQNFPIELEIVTGQETVVDIKSKIESVYEIPVSFQRLIYAGRELNDTALVSSYRIEDGHTLHMVLRQNRPVQPSPQPLQAQIPEGFQVHVAAAGVGVGGDPQRSMDVLQLSRAVKMFAIIDAIFLLLWSFSFWPLAIAVCMAMSGYYGAQHFRLRYVCLYVIYLLGSIALRVYWMAKDGNFMFTLVLVLGVLIQFYILNITMKFIGLLRTLTPQDRAELIALRSPAAPM